LTVSTEDKERTIHLVNDKWADVTREPFGIGLGVKERVLRSLRAHDFGLPSHPL